MRSFSVLLAVMLTFWTVRPDALADDAVARRLVEQAKQSQLRKGMTYDEVVKVMGREPTHQGESITYGNGAVGTFYYWSEEGADTFSTDFVDGRLSQFGMTWVESPPPPDHARSEAERKHVRLALERYKHSQLRKGMTYEGVRNLIGREPAHQNEGVTYGNGAVGTFYFWSDEGAGAIHTDFVDGRLSQFGISLTGPEYGWGPILYPAPPR